MKNVVLLLATTLVLSACINRYTTISPTPADTCYKSPDKVTDWVSGYCCYRKAYYMSVSKEPLVKNTCDDLELYK